MYPTNALTAVCIYFLAGVFTSCAATRYVVSGAGWPCCRTVGIRPAWFGLAVVAWPAFAAVGLVRGASEGVQWLVRWLIFERI